MKNAEWVNPYQPGDFAADSLFALAEVGLLVSTVNLFRNRNNDDQGPGAPKVSSEVAQKKEGGWFSQAKKEEPAKKRDFDPSIFK